MLVDDYQTQLKAMLEEVDCRIRLPEKWAGTFFVERGGVQPTAYDERRRHVRVEVRTRAILHIQKSMPCISRRRVTHQIYTRNISRSGVGFLHSEQLYPCELCEIWLPDQKAMIEVVHCRYLGECCYAIGAQTVGCEIEQFVT
ncbi:MAG: PilZ domain-containing protein [Pirellulales bacterium]|nr:PilZ domain-containing protein [Pirellulales bacterium]